MRRVTWLGKAMVVAMVWWLAQTDAPTGCAQAEGDMGELSSILKRAPCSYHDISRDEADHLLREDTNSVLHSIRKAFTESACSGKESILSQHAIIYLGVFGNRLDEEIIRGTWDCHRACRTALPPCEYYCAYKFSLDLFDVRFIERFVEKSRAEEWPSYHNNSTSYLKVDAIGDVLRHLSEPDLLASLNEKAKRPALPPAITAGMHSVESYYYYAVLFELALRGKDVETRNALLKELLYFYGRDASGDGGVSFLEHAIKCIQSRIHRPAVE